MKAFKKLNTGFLAFSAWIYTMALGSTALAQNIGKLKKFDDTLHSVLTWAQGIGLALVVLGFVRVGVMYSQGDDRAPVHLKNTAIGGAIIAGAAIIVQFIKSNLLENYTG